MDVQGIGRTDVGLVRKGNEDAYVADSELGLYVVCDGMGGHAAGEIASSMAISSIERSVREQRDVIAQVEQSPVLFADDLTGIAADAIRRACQEVYAKASSDGELAGMGCTATVLLVAGHKAAMAHVGDTRLYLIRNGQAHQLSFDHTLAAEFVRQGHLQPGAERGHPQSHVLTRSIGPQAEVEVETLTFDVAPGDRFLLCSDGLSDHIPSEDWLSEHSSANIEQLPDDLVDFALGCGGHDNITVIAVQVDEEPAAIDHDGVRNEHLIEILGSSYLFSNLSLAQLSRVLDRAEVENYQPDETIRGYGDIVSELLIVIKGTVRVEGPDGRSALVGRGQHLGEALVLRPRPIRGRVVANEQATLLSIDGPNLKDLANRRPWLGVALLSRLVERLSGDLDRLADDEHKTSSQVAHHIL